MNENNTNIEQKVNLIKDIIYQRRSTRLFTDEEISDEIIKDLLENAMAAPSACNKRPWEFYVIKNKEKQNELQMVSRYSNYQSNLIIIVCANTKRSLANRDNDFWIQDCSAAIENILLTCEAYGIGTCWCGIFPVVTIGKRVKKILDLEDHIIPLGLIHLGYKAEIKEKRTQYDEKRVHYIE